MAGESFIAIENDKHLMDCFMEASQQMEVVLACRVSPQQKASIVTMVREQFPKKGTLAIGDGANDVNMIL